MQHPKIAADDRLPSFDHLKDKADALHFYIFLAPQHSPHNRKLRALPLLLEKGAHALKFSPGGLAPEYALMSYLQCSLGQGAQENATYNVGKFIEHSIGNPQLKTKLVKPKEFHSDAGAPFLQALMAAQPTDQTPLMAMGTQALNESIAKMDADVKVARAAWSTLQDETAEGTSIYDSPALKDFETILGLVAPVASPRGQIAQ